MKRQKSAQILLLTTTTVCLLGFQNCSPGFSQAPMAGSALASSVPTSVTATPTPDQPSSLDSFDAQLTAYAATQPAAGTSGAYPTSWIVADTSGIEVPVSSLSQVWGDDFSTLSIVNNGQTGTWYSGIHSKLGVGANAAPGSPNFSHDAQGHAIFQATSSNGLISGTITDVNIQSVDAKGNGFMMQNGYYEVRAQMPIQTGNHAGVWFESMQSGVGHVEVDLVESYGYHDQKGTGDHLTAHIWPAGSSIYKSASAAEYYANIPGLQTELHAWGFAMTSNWFASFIDGKLHAIIKRLPEQNVPMYVLLSDFTDSNRSDGYQFPAVMTVDYVHAYGFN